MASQPDVITAPQVWPSFSANSAPIRLPQRLKTDWASIPDQTHSRVEMNVVMLGALDARAQDTRDVAQDHWQVLLGEEASVRMAFDVAATRDRNVTRYPQWLEIASAASIGITVVGGLAMFATTTYGALVAGVGFAGIWLFGSLAQGHGGFGDDRRRTN